MEWPDWSQGPVAIVASGPSAAKADLNLLRDRVVTFAIKKNLELCPWAEAVYGCDYGWWRSVHGLPDFAGLKMAYDAKAVARYGLRKIEIPVAESEALLFDQVGVVGAGGCSGFQALNLAVQFGARRIVLIGFDNTDRAGVHWYGRNMWQGSANPGFSQFSRWMRSFKAAAGQLAERGVEVVNASPITDCKAFPRQGLAETLDRWNA